jgi:hypothetical protein
VDDLIDEESRALEPRNAALRLVALTVVAGKCRELEGGGFLAPTAYERICEGFGWPQTFVGQS